MILRGRQVFLGVGQIVALPCQTLESPKGKSTRCDNLSHIRVFHHPRLSSRGTAQPTAAALAATKRTAAMAEAGKPTCWHPDLKAGDGESAT